MVNHMMKVTWAVIYKSDKMFLALAGITQQQVDAGVSLGSCLHLFRMWLNQLCDQHQLTFTTAQPGHLVAFATWTGKSPTLAFSDSLEGVIRYLFHFLLDFP